MFSVTTRGNHWYISGPNIYRMTGSLPNDETGRPASIAHVEVEQERKGTGKAAVIRALHLFRAMGLSEFVTTGQTISGEKLFASLERDGMIRRTGNWNGEPIYRIVRTP